jgi:hypothetical protein
MRTVSSIKSLVRLVALFFALQQVACVEAILEPIEESGGVELRTLPERPSLPTLYDGQTWQVTTAFPADATARDTAQAPDPGVWWPQDSEPRKHSGAPANIDADAWSSGVTWEFRVVRASFVPAPGSRLYNVALDSDGAAQPLALVEAVVVNEENLDVQVKALAPVFDLVLRRHDYEIVAVDYSYWTAGGRAARSLDLEDIASDWLVSQLDREHCLVDFLLPEFPLDSTDEMTVNRIGDGAVEVAFTSALDGSLVVQRWDAGRPWFTYSRSDRRVSRLVGE